MPSFFRSRHFPLCLVLAAGVAAPVWAVDPDDVAIVERAEDAANIAFNFKDAPFDQVLDFFSRESGLPIIRETTIPDNASMTFISAKKYTFDEALSILNLSLQMHGLHLRRESNFLYLGTLEGSFTKPSPVMDGGIDDGTPPDRIVTVTLPLSNAMAELVVEQIRPLISQYGGIQAVAAQNMVIITESAAQVRRLSEIIRAIDSTKPMDSATELFVLRHSDPETVVNALKALIGERIKKIIVDKNGKQTVVEEETVPQVQLYPDPRTNTVLVTGAESRIETVRELVALLDVPEGAAGENQMMTFDLASITSAEAATHLNALFGAIPEARRPIVLPLSEVNKITVVANPSLLMQARALIGEIDPGSDQTTQGDARVPARVARTIRLEHVDARSIEQVIARLLTPRQRQLVKFTSTQNRTGLLVAGSPADVDAFESLVRNIDVAPELKRDIRLLELASRDPAATVARAESLFAQLGRDDSEALSITIDERTLTLVGSPEQIADFERMLRSAEALIKVTLETRRYELGVRKPSDIAKQLPRIAGPMLDPADGSPFTIPQFDPIDELETLIVRAEPSQFAVIDELIQRLDAAQPGDTDLRVTRVNRGDISQIAARARELFDEHAANRDDIEAPNVRIDEASGSLLISGSPESIRMFDDAVRQAQQLLPPDRTTRIYDVEHVQASEILAPLTQLMESADPIDPSRKVPDPTVQIIERTNSLLVTGEVAQHQLISQFITRLDSLEPTDLPPLKLLQLRTADAVAIAAMLSQQYTKRPQADRAARPVEVRADAATNTLIVSAHPELFDEIKAFVDDLNTERVEGPERITFLFTLKVAKAVDVAKAMDKLYPEPPMPRDRRNQPMPWLQKDKEVTVSADPSSNSLIIDAPADRRESLEELAEKLDRVEVPPIAELRTYHIEKADLTAIARTLENLSRNGNLSAPATTGGQAVRVVIETEPLSSTLIVAGDELTFERVEQMLEDLSAVPIERGLRIVPIANADAVDVRARAVGIYEAQVAQISGAGAVDVTVNGETNSLEVVADDEAMRRFMDVLDELQRQAGPAREMRLIELRFAKAETVVGFLTDLVSSSASFRAGGGADPVFEAIEATNTLMVAAQPSQLPLIEQLVRNLDSEQQGEQPPIRILRLRSTDASNLASVLQSAYDRRPVEDKSKRPVSIQADGATNTLIVSAHAEILPEIEQLITDLNEQQAYDDEGREIRIFPLKVARAEDLAKTIDAMFPEPPMPMDPRTRRPRPDLQQPKEVVVRADTATNSIIVDAPAKRLAGFEQLVRSLDQHKLTDDIEVRTYRIERAELGAVSRTLTELARTGALGATGQTQVIIETEPMSRSLIVSGPSAIFAGVETVLNDLDLRPDMPETTMRLYPLKHARAERVQPLLERLLEQRIREDRNRESGVVVDIRSLLEVAADGASNTLIIAAPEPIQQVAQQLIEALDVEAAQIGRSIIRVVPLTYASASDVSETLKQAQPGIDWPSGGDNLSIIPAAGSNALVLTGAQGDLDKLQELIEPLDRRPSDDDAPGVETFELEFAEASEIAKTVERLLGDQLASDPRVLAAQIRYYRGQIPRQATVRVEADARTNALIVSGPTASLELAREIITRIDQPASDTDRTVLTFTPTKAEPDALIRTVSRIIEAKLPTERRPLELVHEARTGSIVAIGSAEQVGEAMRQLGEFDDRAIAMPALDLQLFDLVHADARAVADTVQAMLSDRTRWPEALRRGERAGLGVPAPRVNAEAEGNRLVISVPTALLPLAQELVATLDTPASGGSTDLRVFRLSRGDASSVAQALSAALAVDLLPGEKAPVVTAETQSNSVVIAASGERLDQAAELIEEMDAATDTTGVGVRTIFLEHARAESIAPLVEQILSRQSALDLIPEFQRLNYLSRRRPGETIDQPVRVIAEPRLNAIVVSAPLAALELAEGVVRELDIDRTGGAMESRIVRVISPTNADAGELAESLEAVLSEDGSDEQPPIIRVDKSSNTLIVRGSEDQLSRIESLVEQIDRATLASSREMRLIRVDPARVDASVMATTLKQLLEQSSGIKVEVISVEDLLKDPGSEGSRSNRLDIRALEWVAPSHQSTLDAIRTMMLATAIGATVQADSGDADQPDADQPDADTSDDDDDPDGGPDGAGAPPGVTIAVDSATNSLVVLGSTRLADRIAALVEQLQSQFPLAPTTVRIVNLPDSIDPRQVTALIRETIRQVGRSSIDNPGGFTGAVAITPDPTGSSVVVWANDTDFQVVGKLIASVARSQGVVSLSVKVYPLTNVDARSAASAVTDLVSPSPAGKQARRVRNLDLTLEDGEGEVSATIDPATVSVTADPGGTSIIVSAPASAFKLIDSFVALIDQSPVNAQYPIRTIKLEDADAAVVAQSLERLFQQRAQIAQRSGRRSTPPVAIIGDRKSGTLVVAASDEDFAQIEQLIPTFDDVAPSKALDIRIVKLENARVSDIEQTINDLSFELRYGGGFFFSSRNQEDQDILVTQVNQRTNSVVLIGNGERLETFERIVRSLDVAPASETERIVRAVPVERADLQAVSRLVEQSLSSPNWRSWMGVDPDGVDIEIDRQQRMLFVMGPRPRVELAIEHINAMDQAATGEGHVIKSIPLEFARADRAARSLERFFEQRARAEGRPGDEVAIIGSQDGNVLIISGPQESVDTVMGLIDQIDQPELGDDRLIEVYTIKNAEVREVARAITQTFPSRRTDERVIVTPQEATSSIIVSAPDTMAPQIEELIALLDSPPSTDDITFVSVLLEKARAADIARTLQSSLPENLKIQITAVDRSNSLLLTGSTETIELVRAQIESLDTAPPKIMQDFRRFEINHARAGEVYFSLSRLIQNRTLGPNEVRPSLDYLIDENAIVVSATPEQMADIEKIIGELDMPSDVSRTTEFVKLRFAEAETVRRVLEIFYGRFAPESVDAEARSVTIVTDTATNSLVISASERSWLGIRALLEKVDTEVYDTKRQIEVIPLAHADATSVAKALNDGFGSQVRRQLEAERAREGAAGRGRGNGERDQPIRLPDVIVSGDDQTPTVSAESMTNSLIIFADRDDLVRIRAIVEQLDLPDILRLPPPRVIPLESGRASELATAVREAFSNLMPRKGSSRGVLIFGDDASNTIIVRAEDEPFEQIAALVATLQGHVDTSRLSSRVLRVSSMPAVRLRDTVLRTFRPVAQQAGEQLSVEVERQSNSLVIASSERIYHEIEGLVEDLDAGFEGVGGAGGMGQSVLIIDIENSSPEQVRQMLIQLGVTRPPPADRPGIVSEPITIVPMRTRSSLAIVASPADAEAVTALVRALDSEPVQSTQHVRVVPLRLADASAVVRTMQAMLSTGAQVGSAPAQALAEHIRRLSITHPDWNKGKLEIDLSLPIKLTPDPQTNSVAIASSEANVRALTDVIEMLDTLPIGDAVVVRIFPMNNASASRVGAIVEQLFRQGEALRRLPGTQRQGLPPTVTGQALAGEISATVDDRTNSLIVAGREEAVAFVETLIAQLDSDEIASWVEPIIIPLEHADPVKLARTLDEVLVRGLRTPPESLGIQQQIARLRIVRDGGDPKGIEADIFAPMTGLVITAEEQLGSLIVVGSPNNLVVVQELVSMLDVEAAGAGNEVRVYPLEHAAADRVAQTLRGIFREREAAGTIRTEDRLIVSSDVRTNTLIVSTSPRSVEILESLLTTLDSADAKESVGVHVLHVPGTDVRQLAVIIESVMRERIAAVRRSGVPESPSDAFSVEASPANNSLIIASSDENLEVVEELIATLTSDDVRNRGDLNTELIYVTKGEAGDLARAIDELYVQRENERRGQGAVNIVSNERLNILIVTGTGEDIAHIRELVESLSQAEVTSEQEIRRIELTTANALEVVNLIQQVLAGRSIAGGRTNAGQVTKINFYRYKFEEGLRELGDMGDEIKTVAEVDDALRQQIRLTPDLRTNSVMIVAPPEIMRLIIEIIEDLDTTTAGNRDIEMFRLVNADAFAMAEVLSDLFSLRQDGNAFVLIPTPTVGPDPLNDDPEDLSIFGGQTVTPVPDQRQELSITVDPRTNTLLVSGTAEYLELVRSVVTELDTIEATERERLVYDLRNAKADEVEATLRDYFESEADRIRQTLRPEQMGSLARLLEQEVTIVGDVKSNKLVVSASPRYMDTIRGIIEELDAAPPQVVIQVLLAEVTIDRSNTWGMDLRVGPLGGDAYLFSSTPAGGAVTTALGLPTFSVASDDFGLLIRALEEQGRLEVLSRPSVTVNNNERAEINIGDDVGIVDGVTTFSDGTTQPVLRREEVGVSIEVTPTISADGFVRLEIIPEISNVSNRTTQVSAGLETPIIARRRVDTVVTIMDGQTIVIGGLIQNTTEDRNTKVPLLGHIPIIGKLFQTQQFSDVRTELLIILTPKVIRGAGDTSVQRALSERAINEVSAQDTIRDILRRGISEDIEQSIDPLLEAKPSGENPVDSQDPEGLLVKPAALDVSPPPE